MNRRRTIAPPLQSKPYPKPKANLTVTQPIRKLWNRPYVFLYEPRVYSFVSVQNRKGKRGHSQVWSMIITDLYFLCTVSERIVSALRFRNPISIAFDFRGFIADWYFLQFFIVICLGWEKQLHCWFHFHSYKKLWVFRLGISWYEHREAFISIYYS